MIFICVFMQLSRCFGMWLKILAGETVIEKWLKAVGFESLTSKYFENALK